MVAKAQARTRTRQVVVYGRLPEPVIRWLRRNWQVVELPELEHEAERLVEKKMRDVEEFWEMQEGRW